MTATATATPGAPEPLVRADGLSKRYCRDLRRSLRYAVADIVAELPWARRRKAGQARPGEFTALDDVSFELGPGEALAVIGANGAGKSTLLKILYGLIKPDGGEVRMRGRIGGLIELGTGFDPVLSGRENIAVNAAILGLDEGAMDDITARVIAFAELEDAIDTPLRYYSSGMMARLAFAVAAHLEPDVLLVDEALAVGDLAFQRKCVTHMRRYLDDGGALIFVSHNPHQIQAVCDRGLLLVDGRCEFTGTAVETLTEYFTTLVGPGSQDGGPRAPLDPANPLVIESIEIASPDGPVATGAPLEIRVGWDSGVASDVHCGFTVWSGDGWVCVTGGFEDEPRELVPGRGSATARIDALPLMPGAYGMRISIVEAATYQPLALVGWQDAAVPFVVEPDRTMAQNAMTALNQLVTVDADWR